MTKKHLNEIDLVLKTHNHLQRCAWCGKEIKKGNYMVSIIRGCFRSCPVYSRYHLKCFKKALKNII